MSIVEKLEIAMKVINEFNLKSVIDVDIYKCNDVSIHVHEISDLKKTKQEIKKGENDSFKYKFVMVNGVKVFTLVR